MQVHGPSVMVDEITVRLNTIDKPFAVVDFGGSVTVHVSSVADADEFLRAAVKVKSLLGGFGWQTGELSPGWHTTGTGEEWLRHLLPVAGAGQAEVT